MCVLISFSGLPGVGKTTVARDRAEHRRRVEKRRSDIVGLDLPDWKHVQSRDYEDWTGDRVVLDTSKLSVNDCVKTIIEALAHAA
jgi:cytidylate kinase